MIFVGVVATLASGCLLVCLISAWWHDKAFSKDPIMETSLLVGLVAMLISSVHTLVTAVQAML
ncbi:hypothetical protein HAP48_0042545 [Bradyrhizobium septentrionale]|uniref:Uncharacterized protein n=1 Tax=Bradyrhizobium septentrionale TaxID=1404411 RepID=A0A973W3C7_9BRAD|nr:hypothetical protein [Bradyrhizobium septentrionale]UGY15139.1 hypothetical protein HAP48_0042545 [Bradyrhizobium septentrionale]UGY23744.1 hypothetical protein HU675_0038325 [Bradyrhizobium septentrionale]